MLQLLSVANYSSLSTEHKGLKKPRRRTVNMRLAMTGLPHYHQKRHQRQQIKEWLQSLNRPHFTSHSLAWNSRLNHVGSLGCPTLCLATIASSLSLLTRIGLQHPLHLPAAQLLFSRYLPGACSTEYLLIMWVYGVNDRPFFVQTF